jgi:hypothetical protein
LHEIDLGRSNSYIQGDSLVEEHSVQLGFALVKEEQSEVDYHGADNMQL